MSRFKDVLDLNQLATPNMGDQAGRHLKARSNGTMHDYLRSFMPSVTFYAMMLLVVAALYLSGVIVVPDQCQSASYDVNTCALFLNSPSTATRVDTQAWTIVSIICASALILMNTPWGLKYFRNSAQGTKWYFYAETFFAAAITITLIVVGSIEVNDYLGRRDKINNGEIPDPDENDREDNGAAALMFGLMGLLTVGILSWTWYARLPGKVLGSAGRLFID